MTTDVLETKYLVQEDGSSRFITEDDHFIILARTIGKVQEESGSGSQGCEPEPNNVSF